MPTRVGIDLVSVQTVSEAVGRFSDRYLGRVYTETELADCRTPAGVDAGRLAARFAAKEAALKVLRPRAEVAVPLRTIEVRRDAHGAPELHLHGSTAALAAAADLRGWSVSLTHEGDYASAVVAAEARA